MTLKSGLEKEYTHYIEVNSDPYSKAVIDAGEAVGTALDEGKTLQEAHDALYGGGLTGFMAGSAIQAVCHFHPRGEELRVWWNEKHGVKSDKGVVNPALITGDTRDDEN